MIQIDRDEIWYWHETIEKQKKSGFTQNKYCRENKISHQKFTQFKYRLVFRKERYPKEYKRLLPLGREYLESGKTASEFAAEHNLNKIDLGNMATHIRYLDILEEIKLEKAADNQPEEQLQSEFKAMSFIQVPKISVPIKIPEKEIPPSPEVLPKQNDIEITISQGVKVSIAPNIDAMKIIKIIELLKDL